MMAIVFIVSIGLAFLFASLGRSWQPKNKNLTRGELMYPEDDHE